MPFDHFDFIAPLYHRIGTYSNLDSMLVYASLPISGSLLDAGGGTGRVANGLRKHVGQIVLADASFGMLRYVESSRIQPAVAISEILPFPDGSFDRVIMVDALHHVINQKDTAHELWRVLKPGGRIVIEEPDIRMFSVKLIAIAEKLLLMRSHFLSPAQIASLFAFAQTDIQAKDGTTWIIIEKA